MADRRLERTRRAYDPDPLPVRLLTTTDGQQVCVRGDDDPATVTLPPSFVQVLRDKDSWKQP